MNQPCRVSIEEARHDREMQSALSAYNQRVEEELPRAESEVFGGSHDHQLANFFDAEEMARNIRVLALAPDAELGYSMIKGYLEEVVGQLNEYAQDLAERRAL